MTMYYLYLLFFCSGKPKYCASQSTKKLKRALTHVSCLQVVQCHGLLPDVITYNFPLSYSSSTILFHAWCFIQPMWHVKPF